MKIFVTGASGYIGNKLVHTLANQGNIVHAFIRPSSAENIFHHRLIKIFKGDLQDKNRIAIDIKGCPQVYHTAGMARLWAKNRDTFYEQNVGSTINVLNVSLQ